MLEKLIIGEIINVHGVKGTLKVMPLTDEPARFADLKKINLVFNSSAPHRQMAGMFREKVAHVESVAFSGEFVLLKFKEINTREMAELMKKVLLEIPREDAISLPEDTYFIGDLIGCDVFEEDQTLLGKVTDVLTTGSNDVYQVRTPEGKEIFLPAIGQVIINVDIENSKITVRLLPGLKDVYL